MKLLCFFLPLFFFFPLKNLNAGFCFVLAWFDLVWGELFFFFTSKFLKETVGGCFNF